MPTPKRGSTRQWQATTVAVLCALTVWSCGDNDGTAAPPAVAFDPALAVSLQVQLDQSRTFYKALGVVAGVQSADGAVWFGASGFATANQAVALRPTDRFRIASVTKMFTAALVFRLVEQGRLRLDDTLDAWYPSVPEARRISIRMLLDHTSGIADYFDRVSPARHWEPDALIDAAVADGLLAAPGTAFAYADTNYVLLARVIEKITASTYRAELRNRLLGPLRLDQTFLEGEDDIPGGFVQGTRRRGGTYEDITHAIDPSLGWSAGGLVSNAPDLLQWVRALFGGRLLRPESLAAMETPARLNDGAQVSDSGGGVEIRELGAGTRYGHLGGISGFSSSVFDLPNRRLAVVVLSNSEAAAWFVAEDLWRVVAPE